MDDEPINLKSIGLPLNLIGIAACAVAIFSSGGLAFLGGAFAVACLGGSFAASLAPGGSSCEWSARECEQAPALSDADEPANSQEASPGHQWRQSVAASRKSCRSR